MPPTAEGDSSPASALAVAVAPPSILGKPLDQRCDGSLADVSDVPLARYRNGVRYPAAHAPPFATFVRPVRARAAVRLVVPSFA